jgi:hypothetical protein
MGEGWQGEVVQWAHTRQQTTWALVHVPLPTAPAAAAHANPALMCTRTCTAPELKRSHESVHAYGHHGHKATWCAK